MLSRSTSVKGDSLTARENVKHRDGSIGETQRGGAESLTVVFITFVRIIVNITHLLQSFTLEFKRGFTMQAIFPGC